MNCKYILLKISLLLFLFQGSINGQVDASRKSSYTLKEHGERLKVSRVLIKLNTDKKKLDILRKNGQIKYLEKFEKELQEEHDKIVEAFVEHFVIDNVYFFYSHHSEDVIKNKNFETVFDSSDSKENIAFLDKPLYLVTLENPPFMGSVSDYWFSFYSLEDGAIKKLDSPFLGWTKTSSLFKKNNFQMAVKRLNKKIDELKYLADEKN